MRLPRRAARPGAHADGDDVPGESPRPERLPRRWRTSGMPRARSRGCPVSRTARAPPGTMARSSSPARGCSMRAVEQRTPWRARPHDSAPDRQPVADLRVGAPAATPPGASTAMVSRLCRKRSFATRPSGITVQRAQKPVADLRLESGAVGDAAGCQPRHRLLGPHSGCRSAPSTSVRRRRSGHARPARARRSLYPTRKG